MPSDVTTMATLRRLRRVARLLDSAIGIPGTRWRIGLDGLIGLIPVVGDLLAALAGLYVITQAAHLGASRWALLRMVFNWAIDSVVGTVPLVGDAFDVLFRVNERNLAILESDLRRRGVLSNADDVH